MEWLRANGLGVKWMRCSEKVQNLLKLFWLKSQNKVMRSNKKTGEEKDEIKCLMKKRQTSSKEMKSWKH